MTPAGPPGTSQTQPTSPVQPGPVARKNQRRGLLLGGSAGVGLRQDGGFAGSLTVGLLLRPSVAIIGDASILGGGCDFDCVDEISSMGVIGGGIKWMMTPRIWTQGTVGVGFAETDEPDTVSGLGWTAAAGFDFFNGPSAALDMRFALLGGFFEEVGPVRGTIGIGLTIR
jgi:hypothetical protein